MICKINTIPTYIKSLDISDENKNYSRNIHNSIVNELMNLTDYNDKNIFVTGTLGEYNVTMINPYINQKSALFIAESKIDELNKKYDNAIKLFDSVGRKVVVLNVSNFAKKLEKTTDAETTKRLLDTGKYFNLTAHVDEKIKQSTLNNVLKFLSSLGIDVNEVDIIQHKLSPFAMADLTKKSIQYVKGYKSTLSEEAAHFLTMLLPKDHPLLVEAMEKIVNDPIYQEVLEEYFDAYEGNIEKLKHEAIGQLVAKKTDKNSKTLFEKIIQWFKELLKTAEDKKDDVFDRLSYRLLNGDISDLSFDNIQDEVAVDGLFFNKTRFQELVDNLETSAKKEKIISSIKKSFSLVNDLSKDLNSIKNEKLEGVDIAKISKITAFLKDTIQKTENTSLSSVNTFVDMVIHTEDFLNDFYNETEFIDKISDINTKLLKVDQLRLATRLLTDKIIPQIAAVGRNIDKKDELSANISNILKLSEYIKNYINVQYQDLAIDILEDKLKDRYIEYKRKFEEEITPLENQLKDAISKNDKKRVKLLEKSIKEKRDFFLINAPSKDIIEKTLTGEIGDASSFGFLVESASMNDNIIINELQNIFKQSIFSRYEEMQKILNESQKQIDKYAETQNVSKNNISNFNKNIIEEVKLLDYIDENGKSHYYYQKALIGEHDTSYISIIQEKTSRIFGLKKLLQKETNSDKRIELEKQLVDAIKDKKKWEQENMELPYTEEYYKVENLLDEDLGEGVTARIKTNDIYELIRIQQRSLKLTTDTLVIESIYEEIDRLNKELKDLKSEFNKTGIDLKVAKQLKKYSEEMKNIAKWELTKDSYAYHEKYILELQRQLDNKEIDEEAYKLLLDRSYVTENSKKYYEKRKDISEKIKNLLSRFSKTQKSNELINENISETYSKIEDIVKKYRNYDGSIDDESIPENEILEIKKLENKIKEYRDSLIKFTGFSQQDLDKKSKLLKQLGSETDNILKEFIRKDIEAINKKAENLALPQAAIDSLYDLMNQLSELTKTEVTDEYTKRLDSEKSKISVDRIDNSKVYEMYGNIYRYNLETNKWESNSSNEFGEYDEFNEEEMNAVYSDYVRSKEVKKEKWYKDNHVEKTRFIQGVAEKYDDPIYIWKKSSPADKEMIEKVPSFRFRERIVDANFINPHFRNTIDGYNVPKKGKFINEQYKKLSEAEKKYLKYWTELYITLQEKYLPENKRLGLFLPSIEKSTFEKASDITIQSLSDSMKEAYEGAKRRFLNNEQDADTSFGNLKDDVYGNMPVLFMGKIDAAQQSSDVATSILTFISHIIKYDSLNKVKPISNAILNTVSIDENKPFIQKKQNILKALINFAGSKTNTNFNEERIKGDSVLQKHVNDLIKSFLYNETEFEQKIGEFNVGKLVNNSMGIAAIGMMAVKPLANIKNNIAGKIQMTLASQLLQNKLYTISNLGYGQMIVPKVMLELTNDYYKVGNLGFYHQLLNKFNAFQGEFYNEFGHKISATILKDVVNIRKLIMIPKNFGEIEMQIVNTLAVLDAIYVEDETGKKVPLHQAFENKGGELKEKFKIPKSKIEEAINKIAYVNIVTNGNYDKMNKTVAEKHSLGRMLLFMNKYFIPFFQFRFAGTKYNASINEVTTGYNGLFVKNILNDIKAGMFPFVNMVKNPKDYTDEEINASLTTAYELAIIASLATMYSLLGGDEPDKYQKLKTDPNGYWKAQLLSMILSIKLETETMHPFFGADNLTQKIKSPFPVARLYENLTKFAYSLNFQEDDYYQKDSGLYKAGDWKGISYLLRLTGVEGMLLEAKYPIERLKRIEQSQTIRN